MLKPLPLPPLLPRKQKEDLERQTTSRPISDEHKLFQDVLAACREGELLATEENAGIKVRKVKATAARGKPQKTEGILNRTLLAKTYTNHLQKQLLKRWMGLARFAINTVDAPANIIDEAIDQALNLMHSDNKVHHHLSFQSRKTLHHTITIRAQNFADNIHRQKDKHILSPLRFVKITSGPIHTRSHVMENLFLTNQQVKVYLGLRDTNTSPRNPSG
ncbi:hypothetical protein G9A89_013499 [Geosiphon pyriformis]|nr:hypothetical protein G9A89_013499 [Geosiphon pyriformis]